MEYCNSCDERASTEEMQNCARCDTLHCMSCLSQEAEDGFLCSDCGTTCPGCDQPIPKTPPHEHLRKCAACNTFLCPDSDVLLVCCNIPVCAGRPACERKVMSDSFRSCCTQGSRVCKDHPRHRKSCVVCHNKPCRDHGKACAVDPSHFVCNGCKTKTRCIDCGKTSCPACPADDHSPQVCRSVSCAQCSVETPCPKHERLFCPCCDAKDSSAGWCARCTGVVSGRAKEHLSGPAVAIVQGYLGCFNATTFSQIVPVHHGRTVSPRALAMQWNITVIRELQLEPSVAQEVQRKSMRTAHIAGHAAVAAFDSIFVAPGQKPRRVLPAFLSRHRVSAPKLAQPALDLQEAVLAKVNRMAIGKRKYVSDKDFAGMFAATAAKHGWKPAKMEVVGEEPARKTKKRKRVRFVEGC